MNRSIRRLYLTLAGGFGLLVLMLGWWQVVAADSLKDHSNNLQQIQIQKLIDRGRILTADGTILAYSRARRVKGQREFARVYPQGDLAAQVVGYTSVDKGKAGIEGSYDRYLAGSFGSQPLLQRLNLKEKQGANVQLSIDSRVQRVAQEQLAGKVGAVVALNPKTGQILAMASSPTFDNQTILTDYPSILAQPNAPLLNRSTIGLYPPGSTFKVVTATSALESGRFEPTSLFPGGSTYKTPGGDIHNFGNATYPPHTLTTALTNSINTTFAQIGDELGAEQLGATMTAYGFGERPPLDLPEVAISGRRKGKEVLPNDQRNEDTARIAIGQEQLTVTPLQMAMVAGAVANGGVVMAPRLMSRIVDRSGAVVKRVDVQKMDTVMSPDDAAQLTTMMEDVVREGTGTAAALSSTGTTVAGKTGTAETADPTKNQAWFIGFAPAEDPTVAIAVVIEDTPGTGGVVAAPVAAQVMRTAIDPGGQGVSFEPGELIGDRYELGRQLGSGGMARVYLGHDRLLDREVAIKVLSEPYASDPQFVERFRREASHAAGLNHPNIVAVYDRGEADGSYYIVMEYLAGPDLKQVIRSRAPLPPLEAIDDAQQILAALGAAHRRDVIHRDVKPQNVLVAEDGHLKVTDFGIARAGAETDMTEAGSVIGTAQYLSPEQARGDEVTAASDCYAVGIVLYEMLTGRVPFDGGPPVAVAMKQISDEPVSPRIVEPSVPRELEAVVLRSLAKRPSERYRTSEEMSRALAEARSAIDGSGGPTRVMPVGPAGVTTGQMTAATRVAGPPPVEPPRGGRRRLWAILGAILVLLVVGGVAFALLASGGDTKQVTVPDVAGQPVALAQAALTNAKFEVQLQTVTDATVDQGLAIGTDPAGGTSADQGSTVVLRVSGGPGESTVPDVTGKTEDQATTALTRAGFQVDSKTEASSTVAKGLVISQDPTGAATAEKGSTVTITVSSGTDQVTVPDVSGQSQSSAEQAIRNAGLVPSASTSPSSSDTPGTVISQDPGGGGKADKGSTVNIVIATAPANVTVPNVVGNTASDARFKLVNAGFQVTSDTADSSEPAGNVIDQNPASGTSVAPGSRIVITVSNGPSSTPTVPAPPPGQTTP